MKRNKQRSYKIATTTDLDYMRVIKIAVGVILVFLLVYLATAKSMGEFNKKTKVKEEELMTV